MLAFGGRLDFSAHDGTSGYELWRSDGTESGITLVMDNNLATNPRNLSQLTNVNETMCLTADYPPNAPVNTGREVWIGTNTISSDFNQDGMLDCDDINALTISGRRQQYASQLRLERRRSGFTVGSRCVAVAGTPRRLPSAPVGGMETLMPAV